ncbi:MAG TPA: hypothetical protein VI702_03630 [Nitrospiria bacterium]
MSGIRATAILTVIALAVIAVAAASWHSVEEIHYLKTFYPASFSVEEAFYASLVELIKVFLIGLPMFLVIVIGLYLMGIVCRNGRV